VRKGSYREEMKAMKIRILTLRLGGVGWGVRRSKKNSMGNDSVN